MMASKQIYLHRPLKIKKNKEPEKGSRTVLIEKINHSLQITLNSLVNTNFKTEISYPNSDDVVIYQTCPKLSRVLFNKKGMEVIRVFLFDKGRIKKIEKKDGMFKSLEQAFRSKMHVELTYYSTIRCVITGLIAIPKKQKQILINELIEFKNQHIKSTLPTSRELSNSLPVYNVGKEYRSFLRDYMNDFMDKKSFVSEIIRNDWLIMSGKFDRIEFCKKNKKWI